MKKFKKILELFISGKTGTERRDEDTVYVATANALVIREFDRFENTRQYILAVRVGNNLLGNSSIITQNYNRQVLPEQLEMSSRVTMIPFSVLQQAGLSFNNFAELDAGPEETLWRKVHIEKATEDKFNALLKDKNVKVKSKRKFKDYQGKNFFELHLLQGQHFAGARLFSVSGRIFLLDIDRVEITHGIVNPFLVEMQDKFVKTISEAYESLKPDAVKRAEAAKIPVLRQGEWFFIPVENELEVARIKRQREQILADAKRLGQRGTPLAGILQAGQNRPNRVTEAIVLKDDHFVTGTVSHTGREHADIKLKKWYRAVPNTSQTSWAITGDLD